MDVQCITSEPKGNKGKKNGGGGSEIEGKMRSWGGFWVLLGGKTNGRSSFCGQDGAMEGEFVNSGHIGENEGELM